MRQILSGLYFVLLSGFALAALGLLWVTGTEAGTQWLIARALAESGVELKLTQPRGTLLGGLHAARLRYADEHTVVEAQQLAVAWSPSPRSPCPFSLRTVAAAELTVTLAERPVNPLAEALLPEFSLPFPVCIEALSVGRLEIRRGERVTAFAAVRGKLHQTAQTLSLDALEFTHERAHTSVSGQIAFARPFPADLKIRLNTDDGALDVQLVGTPRDYRLTADARIARADWPPGAWHLAGRGDLDYLDVTAFEGQTLGGTLAGSGRLDWRNGLALRAQVQARGVDPAGLPSAAALQGRIDAAGDVAYAAGVWTTRLDATGVLRGHRLKASAEASLRKHGIDLRAGRIEIGQNRVEFRGAADRERARGLDLRISAPNLAALHPELAGAVNGSARVDGPWRQPRLTLDLTGTGWAWWGFGVGSTRLQVTPSAGGRHVLKLEADRLSGAAALGTLKLTAEGSLLAHSGTFRIAGTPQAFEARGAFSGGYAPDAAAWQGTLRDGTLRLDKLPTYRQASESRLEIGRNRQKLAETCFAGPQERVCLGGDLDADLNGSGNVRLTGLPLRRLAAWVPQAHALRSALEAELDVSGEAGVWYAQLGASLDDTNRIAGRLALDRATQALSGKLEAYFDRLHWLVLAREDLDSPTGNVFADLEIGGSLRAPTLTGPITLGHASVRVPAWGTEIRDIGMVATLATDRAVLGGQAFAGRGKITLEGEADWANAGNRRLELAITGADFEAVDLPVIHARVAPRLKLVVSPAGASLEGTVQIDPAEVNLATLPASAVRPSEDEVILNREEASATTDAPGLPLRTDVLLQLGEKVHISGQGLDGYLRGALRVREKPREPLRLFGTLQVVDGKYKAYGQNLEIERGELYFNGPLRNPSINLRAVRKAEDVTAGLRLLGTLELPQSSVFSEPPMAETDAMAYLLTGKPLSAATQGEANLMVAAVTQLGLKGGGALIDLIRGQTGLDVFELDSGTEYSQSALLIGKYLTARLYVQYAIKLFEETDIFSLRYRLTRNLLLEAESGTSQGIDLIYQIER